MDKPIVADSLDDFISTKHDFGLPLRYLNGGIAIWDAKLHCKHMSEYLKDVLSIPVGSVDKWENANGLLDQEFLSEGGQLNERNLKGWQTRKTYITDRGVRYIDMVVRPIVNKSDDTLGYMSVCQDVTNHHEPLVFQEKLNGLLRCVAFGDSPDKTVHVIYDCVELLGFRDVTIIVNDTNVNRLDVVGRVIRGNDQEKNDSWPVEPSAYTNPMVQSVFDFRKAGKISPLIFNEGADLGWGWSKCPYVCLPVVHERVLLGFLIMAQSHCYSLTPELLDSSGRTTMFLRDLAPVFKRVYNDPRNSEVYRKWALMREKLERMNLNQKQITILEMIVKGETNKGIAHVVNLSEQGVKYHVGNLLEIFQTKNRLELRSKLQKILQTA